MVETTITRALRFEIMQLRQIQSTLQFIVTSRVLACLGISTIGGFYGGSSAMGGCFWCWSGRYWDTPAYTAKVDGRPTVDLDSAMSWWRRQPVDGAGGLPVSTAGVHRAKTIRRRNSFPKWRFLTRDGSAGRQWGGFGARKMAAVARVVDNDGFDLSGAHSDGDSAVTGLDTLRNEATSTHSNSFWLSNVHLPNEKGWRNRKRPALWTCPPN